MADIFISYKSERRKAAEHFAEVLQRHGYTVWFDYELVKGRDFAEQIETRIKAAKAVVTLWCSLAIGSRWVKEEAHLAQKLGIYTPVKIEPVNPPFGYLLDDTINLSGWDGDPRSHDLDPLLNDLERKVGRAAVPDRRALMEYQAQWRRFGALSLKVFALAATAPVEEPRLRFDQKPETVKKATLPDGYVRVAEHVRKRSPAITPTLPATAVHPFLANGYEDAAARLVRAFTGHTSSVRSVTFSPDGRFALSGSVDNTLKLWDVSTGREVRAFTGHTYSVWSVTFSPDGRFALSGSSDNTLKLWDVSTGREVRAFTGHTNWVTSVTFSPDGRFALSGSVDKTLKLWDVSTGREVCAFTGHTSFVLSVAFSPDGRFALSGSWDKTLKLWDVSTGREVRAFTGHANPVYSVAFSPDGRFALSGSDDKTLKLWDVSTGREVRAFTGHTSDVYSVTFSPDGRYIVSGSGAWDATTSSFKKGKIKLWVAATRAEIFSRDFPDFSVWSVAFSPDGRFVLSGSDDKTLKLWDVSEWTQAP